MFDSIKPNVDILVAQQHTRRKIDSYSSGVLEIPKFNYHTKTVESKCTISSLKDKLEKLNTHDSKNEQKISELFKSHNTGDALRKTVTTKIGGL